MFSQILSLYVGEMSQKVLKKFEKGHQFDTGNSCIFKACGKTCSAFARKQLLWKNVWQAEVSLLLRHKLSQVQKENLWNQGCLTERLI